MRVQLCTTDLLTACTAVDCSWEIPADEDAAAVVRSTAAAALIDFAANDHATDHVTYLREAP